MSCKFTRGEFLRCPGSNDRWISTGGALRKFSDAGLKEFNRLRPASNGGSRQVSCADIKACKVGEPATTANMTSTLAHWDAAHPTTAPSNPAAGTSAPAQTQAPSAAQGTCKFEKGVVVAYAGVSPDVDWYMFESTNRMWLLPRDIRSQVQARRPGFVPTIASRADIDSCTQRPAANPKDIDEVLLLLDAGPMQGFSRPAATSAPTTSPWATKQPGCNFEKGALVQCMGEVEDWYLFDGSKTWTVQGADAKSALVKSRPGLKPMQASCDQISSCPWRGIAAPTDLPEMLALLDAGPMFRPQTLAPGPTCQPRTTGAPVLPICTEAPTDFEKTTCSAAGGKLVAREMYGQTFAYCVFPNGTSCQVDDIASGWCSAPTNPPLTQAPTKEPVQPPPWMQQPQQNTRQNQLLDLLPSLFGGAGSDVPGNDTSVGGGGSGLGFATVDAGGASAGTGLDPSAATKFFGDQTGQANTGVTSDIVANLGQQQQYDTSLNDRVPQPVPVVMPNTTPQGPAVGGEGTTTPAPTGATSGEEAALAQIQSLLAAKTAVPAADETAFFRLKNPILWILVAALIAIVFIIYKKYSLSKTAAAQSASA